MCCSGTIFFFVSQISVVGDPVLNVNCLHVQSFDAELYRQLISYPQVPPPSVGTCIVTFVFQAVLTCFKLCLQEVIPTFDMAVNELFFERFPDSILEYQIQVRPYNALKTRNMRSLNPEGACWIRPTRNGVVIPPSVWGFLSDEM